MRYSTANNCQYLQNKLLDMHCLHHTVYASSRAYAFVCVCSLHCLINLHCTSLMLACIAKCVKLTLVRLFCLYRLFKSSLNITE